VRSQDIRGGVFKVAEAARVSDITYAERIARAEPRFGDLFYSREGTYFGIAAEVPANVQVCLGQRMVLIRPDPTKLNVRFLRFWLNSPLLGGHIHGFRDGTVAERLNMPTIRALPVPVFGRSEQDAIASILGALDDKIDLNRRMNATLEAMARAIFKDWFVDFGPTRAKMEGRAPYLTSEIWSLFPDRLDEEGKPEGWISRPLSAFIELVGGGTPKTDKPEFWGGDIPWFSVVDAPTSSDVFVTKTEKTITQEGLASCSARLLPKGATIITARGTVGKLAVAGRPMTANQSCYGVLGHGSIPPQFVYFLLRDAILRLQANTHGSVFDTITRATFSSVSAIRPRDAVMISFGQLVKPLMDRIHANVEESRTLAATRDLLLPKLMSGELRVKGAEEMLEVTA
jgi:type I restriction enzyme S subunit